MTRFGYVAEVTLSYPEGDIDLADLELPLTAEILIRRDKTQACVAQRIAHKQDGRMAGWILGKPFTTRYREVVDAGWPGSWDIRIPINGGQRWLLSWLLPRELRAADTDD